MKSGIVIVDDHFPFRTVMRNHIHKNSDLKVWQEFPDGRKFLEAQIDDRCSIVLLDISMPRLDGLTVLSKLPGCHPQLRPIIVSGQASDAYRRLAFEKGAAGFVTKDDVYRDLIPCIQKVLAGERWFPESPE